jgi:hypothetical protein
MNELGILSAIRIMLLGIVVDGSSSEEGCEAKDIL